MRLGIDFGTSYSLPVASYLGEETLLLPSGTYGVPSVIYYDREYDEVLVGDEAEDAGQGDCAKNLKREIKMELNSTVVLDGRSFSGKEIVGHILAKVTDLAMDIARQKLIDEDLEGVVISVPAAFKHNEKEYIRQAASIPKEKGGPGLKVLGFIKEPVAAALSYFKEPLANKSKVLVYDLGGGTCDVAVVEARDTVDEKFVVLESDMVRIGGKNWDAHLTNYLIGEIEKQSGIKNIKNMPELCAKIRKAAIDVKHSFSQKVGSKLKDRVRGRVEINGKLYQVQVTRNSFYSMTDGLMTETIALVETVLSKSGCKDVDTIICVGGSSNMPQVIESLNEHFPNMEVKLYEPEKAIAVGAAIYASNFDADDVQENTSFLKDRAAFFYGIRGHYGSEANKKESIKNIIMRSTELPCQYENVYYPLNDNQDSVKFPIYESSIDKEIYELTEITERERIMDVDLPLPPNTSSDTPIDVTMTLTADGIIEVTADDRRGNVITGRKQLNF